MEFVPHHHTLSEKAPGYALVILLHAGLIFGLIHATKTHSTAPKINTTQVTLTRDQPKPPEPEKPIIKQSKEISLDTPQNIADWTPPIEIAAPATPSTNTGVAPAQSIGPGPMAPAAEQTQKALPAREVGVVCQNYGRIREILSEKLPLIASQANFEEAGISRFEMNMELSIGPRGEVLGSRLLQASNAQAAQAMRSTVERALRQLSCAGNGQTQSLHVPLGFVLSD